MRVNAIGLVVILLLCRTSLAEQPPKPAPAGALKFKDTCRDDIARFCKDVKPGGGRIIDCLLEHSDEITPACKGLLKKRPMKSK